MNTQQLNEAIFNRIKKHWIFTLVAALVIALVLTFYALSTPVTFTSTATIFPLTGGSDNSSGSSVLSALMGGTDIGKSFTEENSVNIVELAMSRTTREEVAKTVVPEKNNKTIAQLLLDDHNNHRGLMEEKVDIKPDDPYLIYWAASVFQQNMNAVITKTSSFQLNYTGRSTEMVQLVSHAFIDKISKFYIQLKREKASRDFDFATTKVDSLEDRDEPKGQELIALDDHTMFTNTSKLEFRLPTENLISDKEMLRAQYANAVANQQNAAYKLQKATPVIKVLDEPDPPYVISKKSPLIYGFIGFIVGLIGFGFFWAMPALIQYSRFEFHKMIYGAKPKS